MQKIFITLSLLLFSLGAIAQTITLHIAVQQNNIERVQEMLDKGEDVNRLDRMGNTALTIAAYQNDEEIFKMLCEHGANLDATDNHGNTPLVICCVKGHYSIAHYLIEQGAYIDQRAKDDQTALMHASVSYQLENNLRLVELLVSSGADPNLTDKYGRTALDYAGTQEIKDFLISQGGLTGAELKKGQ